jgi:hypothetical protein
MLFVSWLFFLLSESLPAYIPPHGHKKLDSKCTLSVEVRVVETKQRVFFWEVWRIYCYSVSIYST